MSKDKKNSQDLTRIEDLSDFLHDEDEEIELLEDEESENVGPKKSMMDLEKESFGDSTSFMQIPDELTEQENDEVQKEDDEEFNSFDDNSFEASDFEHDSFESEDSFDSFKESSDDELNQDDNESADFTTDFEEEIATNDTEDEFSATDEFQDEDPVVAVDDFSKNEDELSESFLETKEEIKAPLVTDKVSPILPPKDYKEPEKLDEIKEFGQIITATDLSIEGNPPFSIILSKIKYQEDADSILEILKEYKIIKKEHEQDARASLERGQILIPRLSEYSAIILCHRLRRFDLNQQMGLSHEIQKSSTYEKSDKGLISKNNINTSIKKFESFDQDNINSDQVQVTSNSTLENYTTIKSITIKSRSKVIDNELLDNENFDRTYEQTQNELIEILKQDAADLKANALLGVSLTLINKSDNQTNFICTVNIAQVVSK